MSVVIGHNLQSHFRLYRRLCVFDLSHNTSGISLTFRTLSSESRNTRWECRQSGRKIPVSLSHISASLSSEFKAISSPYNLASSLTAQIKSIELWLRQAASNNKRLLVSKSHSNPCLIIGCSQQSPTPGQRIGVLVDCHVTILVSEFPFARLVKKWFTCQLKSLRSIHYFLSQAYRCSRVNRSLPYHDQVDQLGKCSIPVSEHRHDYHI